MKATSPTPRPTPFHVMISPATPDKGDNDRFARLCYLLMQYRREDESTGHRYIDGQGKPIAPIGAGGNP